MNAYHVKLDALGDPSRRAIFEHLFKRPMSVSEVARKFPISRPAVSQHLRVLKDGELVIQRQAGTRRIYQPSPAGVAALRSYFDQFWSRALASFKKTVEEGNSK